MAENKFVVFEGMDGVGKSTQAKMIAEHWGALYTKQPSEEAFSEPFRAMLLDPESEISDYVESLIFTADRALHVERVLRPALEAGKNVICDRYVGSFLAYQGYGRGGDIDFLRELCDRATGGLEPDLVILLWRDDPTNNISEKDRIEGESIEFQKRVRDGYLELFNANPETWHLVNAEGSKEEVFLEISHLIPTKFDS